MGKKRVAGQISIHAKIYMHYVKSIDIIRLLDDAWYRCEGGVFQ